MILAILFLLDFSILIVIFAVCNLLLLSIITCEDKDSFPDSFAVPLPPKVKKRTEKYVLFVRLAVHVNH